MATHRIAVIAGDGIGKEVMPEGLRVVEAAARKFGVDVEFTSFDWSCDYYAKHGKMMPDDWFEQLSRVRRDLLRRGRLAGDGARSRVAVGLAHQVPPRLRPVRELAAVQADAGHSVAAGQSQAGRHRLRRRPREHRGRVFVGRRPDVRGHRARNRVPAVGVLAQGRRPHPALRVRARAHAPGAST